MFWYHTIHYLSSSNSCHIFQISTFTDFQVAMTLNLRALFMLAFLCRQSMTYGREICESKRSLCEGAYIGCQVKVNFCDPSAFYCKKAPCSLIYNQCIARCHWDYKAFRIILFDKVVGHNHEIFRFKKRGEIRCNPIVESKV